MAKQIKNKALVAGMPEHIDPMLCTLVKEPLDSTAYLYELKWDGYRIISRVENNLVRMNSRSGLDYTSRYPLLAESLQNLGHDLMIDGEVVVFNEEHKPDFDALQVYNGKRTPIRYCVFDLLYLDGNSLMNLPLYQRKELLKTLIKDHEFLLYSESFDDGMALYEKALEDNLEGIVAKKKDSIYIPGARGNDWLKVPTRKRQEFVIGGWAESDKSRSFKSLLFGTFEKGKFTWIGRSGGGYKQIEMPGILKMLKAIEIDQSPFANKILDTKGAKIHYVKPELVANFEFAAWTKSGRIRKPATFLGFRMDKNPADVVREVPKDMPEPTVGLADAQELIFVVQKHAAAHLHYDFRLEMQGVLKSWAVPKGPSMNPAHHRIAMATADQPYGDKDFEGVIPKGQNGAGTVLVWDNGTYEPAEKIEGKKEQEHALLSGYYKNKLTVILHGKKLKGKFKLIKTHDGADNSWLLTKMNDGLQQMDDVTRKDQSVLSGFTLLEVAMNSHSKP